MTKKRGQIFLDLAPACPEQELYTTHTSVPGVCNGVDFPKILDNLFALALSMKTTKITAWHIILILAAIGGSLNTSYVPQSRQSDGSPRAWQVYFSPQGGATTAIRVALDRADKSVLVQAYWFTSAPIAEALVRAQKRGVAIQVILDRSQRTEKYSSADFLANSGILTTIDVAHAIAHNKVMIIDGKTVITGSFNFIKAAEERNAENLLIIHDDRLAARYTENWQFHQAHTALFSRMTGDNQRSSLPAMSL